MPALPVYVQLVQHVRAANSCSEEGSKWALAMMRLLLIWSESLAVDVACTDLMYRDVGMEIQASIFFQIETQTYRFLGVFIDDLLINI